MKFYRVNIEISNVCNLQCTFCPEVIRPKGMMSEALFREVVSQVSALTKVITFHLMGEPLLHPKLSRFFDITHELGVRVFLVTNGVLLKPKDHALLLHPCLQQVSFSLHSFRDNFPSGDLAEYLENIFNYTELALKERPELFINYRLWNLSDAKGQRTENREVLSKVESRFGVALPTSVDLSERKNQPVQGRLFLHFDTEFVWPAMDLPQLGVTGTCQGLKSHFGVLVDGTVVPCCLDKEGVVALGKIPETPLREILQSPRAKAMRAGFQVGQLVESLCQRCQYIERFQVSAL